MEYLTYGKFVKNAEQNMAFSDDGTPVGHWKATNIKSRWNYHSQAIEIMKKAGPTIPQKILEMGTMGAQIVHDSHTIDYDDRGFNPTYLHNARQIPWPMQNKQYEWFIALRVFHHLWPMQRECFEEARRIAKNVLLVVPPEVPESELRRKPRMDAGITPMQFLSWTNSVPPREWKPLRGFGSLYWWSDELPLSWSVSRHRVAYIAKVNIFMALRRVKKSINSLLKKV